MATTDKDGDKQHPRSLYAHTTLTIKWHRTTVTRV